MKRGQIDLQLIEHRLGLQTTQLPARRLGKTPSAVLYIVQLSDPLQRLVRFPRIVAARILELSPRMRPTGDFDNLAV